MKFLKNSLDQLSANDCKTSPEGQSEPDDMIHSDTAPDAVGKYSLPLVRLDISLDEEGGGITSAVAGIMTQPTGEKICTLQVFIVSPCNIFA